MPTVSPRAAAKERTREALLDTGFELAETTGLDGLSVNAVTAAAGVAKGTFFHHFGDRTSYVIALHRRFHDRILDDVQKAVAGLPSGRERLTAMATTYLDACLQHRGVRALILEARALPPIQAEIIRRNDATVALLTTDFVALGWRAPATAARLWVGACVECAILELESGHADAQARTTLVAFATAAGEPSS
ncbi:TetR/AcrR family transcriptional regulator [Mycolicibacterium palauense]|uniref:TetR/AcrR family transcriptional regulator n=1 Tax=Mycolicibacterium palauense TaxID=2034511 RepID=UPI000BFED668|nr:TetR/AcrR family transcriptional regulator [Mycolicibacterium palauense]